MSFLSQNGQDTLLGKVEGAYKGAICYACKLSRLSRTSEWSVVMRQSSALNSHEQGKSSCSEALAGHMSERLTFPRLANERIHLNMENSQMRGLCCYDDLGVTAQTRQGWDHQLRLLLHLLLSDGGTTRSCGGAFAHCWLSALLFQESFSHHDQ